MVGTDGDFLPEDVPLFKKGEVSPGDITRVNPERIGGSLVYEGPEETWEFLRIDPEDIGLDTDGTTRELTVQIERILYPAHGGPGYLILGEIINTSTISKSSSQSEGSDSTSKQTHSDGPSQRVNKQGTGKESKTDPDLMREIKPSKL